MAILYVLMSLVFIQVDVQTLQQQSADSVPLLGGDKGAKDDRGEEEDEEVGEEPSSEGADRWKWQSDKQTNRFKSIYSS